MSDIECPYCGAGQEICHDDGFGFSEDERHEQECGDCGKTFVFLTSILFSYEARQADCLNGADHTLKPTKTYPVKYSRMACTQCDYERQPTADELSAILTEAGELQEDKG